MLTELCFVWALHSTSLADSPLPQNLSISQIKISGDEFVVIRNNTNSDVQLSNYWLQYFNEASLSVVGISSNSFQLPDAKLQPNREIILSAGVAPVCGQVLVAKLPFSLKDSAGMLQVVAVTQSGNFIGYGPQDQVTWSNAKTNNSADLKLPTSQDSKQVWFRAAPESAWQSGLIDYNSACQAAGSANAGSGTSSPATLELYSGVPPYVVLGSSPGSSSSAEIPASDIGLLAPQISEILPNPAPPQTDSADEFIELYNPNDKAFDLSGFSLQSGTSTVHEYTFPRGGEIIIEPKQFAAYYVSQTGLTLSNSSGQVKFLDPAGNTLSETEAYSSAKDGQAFVFAAGAWQWTTTATPGSTNVVTAPQLAKKTTKNSGSKTGVKGASSANLATSNAGQESTTRNLHPLILAGVGALALLYAGYEYRHDVANAYHKFHRNRAARREAGPVAQAGRGD